MIEQAISDEIIKILKDLNPGLNISFNNATNLFGAGLFDSFSIIKFIAKIEKIFDLKISGEELNTQNFGRIEDIVKFIMTKKKK